MSDQRTEEPTVAIVGGGIGGLASAIALTDRGYDVAVYEQADELRAAGAGLWIPPNGVAALDRLGVATAIRERGVELDGTEIRSASGAVLARTEVEKVGVAEGDYPLLAVHRAAVVDALAAQLQSDRIHRGKRAVAVDPAAPTVRFADGSTVAPTILVGADGVGSTVRSAVSPADPTYVGAVAFRGLVETSLPPEAYETGVAVWGPNVDVGYSAIGPDRAWWFASVPADDSDDVPALAPDALADRCAALPEPIERLLRETATDDCIRTPLLTLPSLSTWTRGNATLLGDAAHAMTPNLSQGSAQAMEDAVALGRAVAEHGPTATALSEYESRRRDRADQLRRQSRLQGRLAGVSNPLMVALRNACLRLLPETIKRRQSAEMFRPAF